MSKDDLWNEKSLRSGHSIGASALAESAVSVLSRRQDRDDSGTRRYMLDHLVRGICSTKGFDSAAILDEMRGQRLSIDALIDAYVPAAARQLGDMWKRDDISFATVTVGSLRLQSLLSTASAESLDFIRPVDDALSMLIVVPLGEDHSLGAFVLAAQLRRLGARVEFSFCESRPDLVSRVQCDTPDMVLFSASCRATLDYIGGTVAKFQEFSAKVPPIVVGGCLRENGTLARDISGADMITRNARDAVTLAANRRRTPPGRKSS